MLHIYIVHEVEVGGDCLRLGLKISMFMLICSLTLILVAGGGVGRLFFHCVLWILSLNETQNSSKKYYILVLNSDTYGKKCEGKGEKMYFKT